MSLYYAEACDEDFHPRYDAKSKEYLYRIINEKVYDPFEFGRAWFLPRSIEDDAVLRMREAAQYIIGEHDFSSFMAEGSDVESTVRNVFYLNIEKKDSLIEISICADGFLYNMVRIIVGTLIEVAYGRIDPADLQKIIKCKDRSEAGMTAPSDGLYLNKVNY